MQERGKVSVPRRGKRAFPNTSVHQTWLRLHRDLCRSSRPGARRDVSRPCQVEILYITLLGTRLIFMNGFREIDGDWLSSTVTYTFELHARYASSGTFLSRRWIPLPLSRRSSESPKKPSESSDSQDFVRQQRGENRAGRAGT
jgi:hypothetical protein